MAGLATGGWPKQLYSQECNPNANYNAESLGLAWSWTGTGNWIGTPTVASDGTVYFIEVRNWYETWVVCLDADGNLSWEAQLLDAAGNPDAGNWENDIILDDGGRLYCIAPGYGGVGAETTLVCLDTADGSEVWRFTPDSGEDVYYGTTFALGEDGTLYLLSTDGISYWMYAVNPDGTQAWKLALGDTYGDPNPEVAYDGTSIWVCMNDFLLQIAKTGSLTSAIDSNDWGEVWPLYPRFDGRLTYPQVFGNRVYCSGYAVYTSGVGTRQWPLFAVNANDGSLAWYWWETGRGPSAIDDDGTVYVGSENYIDAADGGRVTAFNPDGTQKWQYTDPTTEPFGPFNIPGQIVWVGRLADSIVALSQFDGDDLILYLIRLDVDTGAELEHLALGVVGNYAYYPAFRDGMRYVPAGDTLYAYDTPPVGGAAVVVGGMWGGPFSRDGLFRRLF